MLVTFYWYVAALVLWGGYWGLLCLVLCLPRVRQSLWLLGAAALVCAWQADALVFLPWFYRVRFLVFQLPFVEVPASYHPVDWLGKVLSLLLSGLVVYGLKWTTPAEVGLTQFQSSSWRPASLVITIVVLAVGLGAYFTRHYSPALWWNERIYYATLPGLAEELFYRGVLLGMLGRVFTRHLPLFGARTHWGGVVGVILFALAHDVKIPPGLTEYLASASQRHNLLEATFWAPLWHLSPSNQLYYLAMGTLLLWVRERTNSCWAAVGTHCLLNTGLLIGASFG